MAFGCFCYFITLTLFTLSLFWKIVNIFSKIYSLELTDLWNVTNQSIFLFSRYKIILIYGCDNLSQQLFLKFAKMATLFPQIFLVFRHVVTAIPPSIFPQPNSNRPSRFVNDLFNWRKLSCRIAFQKAAIPHLRAPKIDGIARNIALSVALFGQFYLLYNHFYDLHIFFLHLYYNIALRFCQEMFFLKNFSAAPPFTIKYHLQPRSDLSRFQQKEKGFSRQWLCVTNCETTRFSHPAFLLKKKKNNASIIFIIS